jgi:hypothetical protein
MIATDKRLRQTADSSPANFSVVPPARSISCAIPS